MSIKRIAVTTGGGDAPGLNAVIRAVTLAGIKRGWQVFGIRSGYDGIMHSEEFPEGGMIPLTKDRVRGIAHTGGDHVELFLTQSQRTEIAGQKQAEGVERLFVFGLGRCGQGGGSGNEQQGRQCGD